MKTEQNTLHIYTRISSASQKDGASIKTQLEEGIKKQKSLGLEYYQHWDEEVASSHRETLENRPVMRELMVSIDEGKVQHLYALDNTRLSRNEETQFLLSVALKKQGVVLHTNALSMDYNNEQDMFLRRILDAVATYDNTMRTIRSRLGKLKRVKEGYWYGGQVPYGYTVVDKKLVSHPEESKWVKKMFEMYYNDIPIIEIKSHLDKNGVLARRGSLFNTGSINRLFRNTHYNGYFTYHDSKYEETVDCVAPRIVDETIWNAVQNKRKDLLTRKGQINRTSHFYLLRDILYCGGCGSPMNGRTKPSKHEHYYFCSNKTRSWGGKKGERPKDEKWVRGKVGDYGCDMTRSINIDIADEFVWKKVIQVVKNSSIIKEGFKQEVLQSTISVGKNKTEVKKQENKQKRIKRDLQRIRKTLADLQSSKLVGDYSGDDESFKIVVENIQSKMTDLNDEMEQSRLRVQQLGNERQWIDWLGRFGKDIDLKSTLTPKLRKEYLSGLLERVEVDLDKETNAHIISLHFKLGLVGDGIKYLNPSKKSQGYDLVEGENETVFEVPFTENRGRKKKTSIIPPLKIHQRPWSSVVRG
jgi:DNA invertase Pin-like site-specific DNA recombinase